MTQALRVEPYEQLHLAQIQRGDEHVATLGAEALIQRCGRPQEVRLCDAPHENGQWAGKEEMYRRARVLGYRVEEQCVEVMDASIHGRRIAQGSLARASRWTSIDPGEHSLVCDRGDRVADLLHAELSAEVDREDNMLDAIGRSCLQAGRKERIFARAHR
ncbi:hypothetical protein WME91_38870 [Sorangium sp. So ce269]